PSRVVEAVYQCWVPRIRFRCANILNAMPFPEAIGTAERRQTAFGADPRTGQDDDAPNPFHRLTLPHLHVKSAGNDIDTFVSEAHRSTMVSEAYHHPIGILPDDIDHMGHVNNSVYLKWVQEAVVDFWEQVAPPEAVAKHLWIALSHESN